MRFKELRKTLSSFDRLSICDRDTTNYQNFLRIADVPKHYDSLYVCGIGTTLSEFYRITEFEYSVEKVEGEGRLVLAPCIEVVTVKKKPKSKADFRFPDLRVFRVPSSTSKE